MNPFVWAVKSIKRRGLLSTVQVGFSSIIDLAFDLKNGTDTLRRKNLQDLSLDSKNKIHGVNYQASKAAPLSRLMKAFEIPKEGTFVDFGSGKGRVLLLAAQCGFRRVIGVEFSTELCEIARKNLAGVSRRLRRSIDCEIHAIDAANFEIQHDQTVLYLYNPFNGVVLNQVMANLRDSLARFPRKVWLIYNTPVHRDVVEKSGLFENVVEFQSQGNQFCVFRN
jgi:SAM-dependent methyltransferase